MMLLIFSVPMMNNNHTGTLDPNTEYGLGPWFKNGLGANATLLTVPFS